ncbi:MAG: addiction module protein [Flavobacteriales bacterium]
MEVARLKSDISKILEGVQDERFLNSILVMIETYNRADVSLSPSQIAELEKRVSDHKLGATKSVPWKQAFSDIRNSVGK